MMKIATVHLDETTKKADESQLQRTNVKRESNFGGVEATTEPGTSTERELEHLHQNVREVDGGLFTKCSGF